MLFWRMFLKVIYTIIFLFIAQLLLSEGNLKSIDQHYPVRHEFCDNSIYDIVIDEIMSDPIPAVGLPAVEWIELKNVSSSSINLSGYRLGKLTTQSGAFPQYILKPDSFLIVCSANSVAAMSAFGHTISVTGFPSLTNANGIIYLLSNNNQLMHAVNYSDSWYQNSIKKNGGWSLEMIDTKNPCSGSSNWKASIDPSGGTPGRKNSLDANNPDHTPPKVIGAFCADSLSIIISFDEPIDSIGASHSNNYLISDGIGNPVTAVPVSPLLNMVKLKLGNRLLATKIYSVTVSGVADCKGNVINGNNIINTGLAVGADSMDVVINEILYNPLPGGVDYVELYNRSKKIINANELFIANRNNLNILNTPIQISVTNNLFFPQEFLLVTSDPQVVRQQYHTLNPNAFIKSSLPTFAIDKGNVVLLNSHGNMIDELNYSDKWQFPLLTNTSGISLERINNNGPSGQENFHSASSSVGFGTPGYKNSQYLPDENVSIGINVVPEIFSPDNDGTDDFATINYHFPSPGYVTNIIIYDANGRAVRLLQQNALSGIKGYYRWDGLGDKMQKLPVGVYLIVTDVFNQEGKKKLFKNQVVLARRF